jgi:4-hydroxy-2-oxoheptanedioate aldolase
VEGVDGIFIGPGDLSADMGRLGQPGHPEVDEAVRDAIRRIRACGKAPGVLTGDERLARGYIEAGALFVAVGSDVGLLVKGSEQLAARFKGGVGV